MTDPTWTQYLLGMLSGGGVIFTIFRSKRQDSDARIDERIKLAVGVPIAEMKAGIDAIKRELPHDFATRMSGAELEIRRLKEDVDTLYNRFREFEKQQNKGA